MIPLKKHCIAEEAAESQHKTLKNYRTHHARKRSRKDNLHDVFIRALNESDPYVSSIWVSKRRSERVSLEYPDEVKEFLIFNDSSDDFDEEDNCEINVIDDLRR